MMKRYTNKRISVKINGQWGYANLIASWETRSGVMLQVGEPYNTVLTYNQDIASEANGHILNLDSNLVDERE